MGLGVCTLTSTEVSLHHILSSKGPVRISVVTCTWAREPRTGGSLEGQGEGQAKRTRARAKRGGQESARLWRVSGHVGQAHCCSSLQAEKWASQPAQSVRGWSVTVTQRFLGSNNQPTKTWRASHSWKDSDSGLTRKPKRAGAREHYLPVCLPCSLPAVCLHGCRRAGVFVVLEDQGSLDASLH